MDDAKCPYTSANPTDSQERGQPIGCPYADGPCPKIDDLEKDVDSVKAMVQGMQKTLYLIAGILFCELGVMVI